MKKLSAAELQELLRDSTTIEQDGHGVKVARLSKGEFIKIYRRKRLLSSSLWSLPSRRFANNATHLNLLGITAPSVKDLLTIPELRLNAVIYCPLPGDTLRNRWKSLDPAEREREIEHFGVFIGTLHELGIYFRSLHLGNVLKLPDEQFGLIDLSDMSISERPLANWKRRRNLRHMLRYQEDAQWLQQQHRQAWLRGYARICGAHAAHRLENQLPRTDMPIK